MASPPAAGPFTGEEYSNNKLEPIWKYFGATLEHIGSTWMHFGVTGTLGSLWGHFGALRDHSDALWGHLVVTLGVFRVTWKRCGVTQGSLWSIWGPLGGTLRSWGSFWSTWGALWDTLGWLWCYLWVYEACFGATFSYFQKTLIFQMNFNDFI